MNQAEIGAIIGALSITFYLLGKFRTLTSIGIFISILLIGINGWIISHVAKLFAWVAGLVGPSLVTFTGVTIGGIAAALVCVVLAIMIHDWMPKNAAKKRTFWLSAAAAVLIASAATPFAALNSLPGNVGTATSTVQGG
jgi:hypothetical protein